MIAPPTNPTEARPANSFDPRWYQRISVRLAVVFVALLLTQRYLGPRLSSALGDAFTDPADLAFIESFNASPEIYVEGHTPGDPLRWGPPRPVRDAALHLLDATVDPAADLDLASVELQRVAEVSFESPLTYFVTAPNLTPIVGTPPADWSALETMDGEDPAFFEFYDIYPLHRGNQLEGWIGLTVNYNESLPFQEARFDELDAAYERMAGAYEQAWLVTAWTLNGASALILIVCVHILVTRRLRRLATAARSTDRGDFARFADRGSDEIAQLSGVLHSARAENDSLLNTLHERDSQRRAWVAEVSHDLRTPLTALEACLDHAVELHGAKDAEAARLELGSTLAMAREDAQRVGALASDLLDLARLELPNALVIESFLVSELIERVVATTTPLALSNGVELDVVGDLGEVEAEVTAGCSSVLLENLVRNAIEHAVAAVELRLTLDPESIAMAVVDDGPGFPIADGRIDAERMRSTRADSAGLGLTMARQVLAAHGRELVLRNGGEGGAVVELRLDRAPLAP